MSNIDVSEEGVGKKLVNQLGMLGGGGGMTEGGVRGFDVVVSDFGRGESRGVGAGIGGEVLMGNIDYHSRLLRDGGFR